MIVKASGRETFTVIANTALRDARLSYRARGVLAYLLSHREDWEVRIAQVTSQGKEGRTAIETALKELKRFGYYKQVTHHGTGGRFESATTVYEIPVPVEPPTASLSSEDPETGSPVSETQAVRSTYEEEPTKNELLKNESSEELQGEELQGEVDERDIKRSETELLKVLSEHGGFDDVVWYLSNPSLHKSRVNSSWMFLGLLESALVTVGYPRPSTPEEQAELFNVKQRIINRDLTLSEALAAA